MCVHVCIVIYFVPFPWQAALQGALQEALLVLLLPHPLLPPSEELVRATVDYNSILYQYYTLYMYMYV